jgi:parvulin-like peptidyl-prolyl isomerase
MGWVARGDLVPELEQAVFSLAPGDLSEVVETQWGFHLLRADERQEAGLATFEEARPGIERTLRARSADERYKKWINELRQRRRVRVLI